MFGIAHIKVDVVHGLDLQEVAFLGDGAVVNFCGCGHSKIPLAGLDRFYDKGCPISNEKTGFSPLAETWFWK
jgi:hypothetical protein